MRLNIIFLYLIPALFIFTLFNESCLNANNKMSWEEDTFSKISLDDINKIKIETLEMPGYQKYNDLLITNQGLIDKIINKIEEFHMVNHRKMVQVAHNHVFTFYNNSKIIVKLEFFISKDRPSNVFFRHHVYSKDGVLISLRQYNAKNDGFYDLVCPLIE